VGTEATSVRHFLGVDWTPNRTRPPDLEAWPFTIPAVAQMIDDGGLDLPAGVTFLVGENGSGKSTLVEALADIRTASSYEDLDLVQTWRSYLEAPGRFLRHLLDD